jgi:hypothetical protein
MRKVSLVKLITLFLLGVTITTFSIQCKKEDSSAVINGLDRSFKGSADSTLYAAFYTTNMFALANPTPTKNDSITFRSIQDVVTENCATSNCHGGPISPKLNSYADIMKYVTPGNPAASKLWTSMTTNDFNKAMPPVSTGNDVAVADKALVFNWITNGAKEKPDANDFRPAAVAVISSGCTSGNCHNEGTSVGSWARKGLIPGLVAADTAVWSTTNLTTGAVSTYLQLNNTTLRSTVLQAYKDSVRKFYADTLANASFRPYKTFSTPIAAASVRGPLNNYDDIVFDINYPKGVRSNTAIAYTDPTTKKAYYVKGDYLNGTSAIVLRVDSTILMANPRTGVWGTTNTGGMANQDGGLKPSEIALIKAWYFSDPNIPDVWKYGINNTGIFKYKVTGKIITK